MKVCNEFIDKMGILDCKPTESPIEVKHGLSIRGDQVPTDKDRYQRLVGRLIYLSHTRPNIAYVVSVVSQFMHFSSKEHMDAVYRVLRYLKSFPDKGLFFGRNKDYEIAGYTNANWTRDQTNRKSTFGYFMFIGKNLVTWRSKCWET